MSFVTSALADIRYSIECHFLSILPKDDDNDENTRRFHPDASPFRLQRRHERYSQAMDQKTPTTTILDMAPSMAILLYYQTTNKHDNHEEGDHSNIDSEFQVAYSTELLVIRSNSSSTSFVPKILKMDPQEYSEYHSKWIMQQPLNSHIRVNQNQNQNQIRSPFESIQHWHTSHSNFTFQDSIMPQSHDFLPFYQQNKQSPFHQTLFQSLLFQPPSERNTNAFDSSNNYNDNHDNHSTNHGDIKPINREERVRYLCQRLMSIDSHLGTKLIYTLALISTKSSPSHSPLSQYNKNDASNRISVKKKTFGTRLDLFQSHTVSSLPPILSLTHDLPPPLSCPPTSVPSPSSSSSSSLSVSLSPTSTPSPQKVYTNRLFGSLFRPRGNNDASYKDLDFHISLPPFQFHSITPQTTNHNDNDHDHHHHVMSLETPLETHQRRTMEWRKDTAPFQASTFSFPAPRFSPSPSPPRHENKFSQDKDMAESQSSLHTIHPMHSPPPPSRLLTMEDDNHNYDDVSMILSHCLSAMYACPSPFFEIHYGHDDDDAPDSLSSMMVCCCNMSDNTHPTCVKPSLLSHFSMAGTHYLQIQSILSITRTGTTTTTRNNLHRYIHMKKDAVFQALLGALSKWIDIYRTCILALHSQIATVSTSTSTPTPSTPLSITPNNNACQNTITSLLQLIHQTKRLREEISLLSSLLSNIVQHYFREKDNGSTGTGDGNAGATGDKGEGRGKSVLYVYILDYLYARYSSARLNGDVNTTGIGMEQDSYSEIPSIVTVKEGKRYGRKQGDFLILQDLFEKSMKPLLLALSVSLFQGKDSQQLVHSSHYLYHQKRKTPFEWIVDIHHEKYQHRMGNHTIDKTEISMNKHPFVLPSFLIDLGEVILRTKFLIQLIRASDLTLYKKVVAQDMILIYTTNISNIQDLMKQFENIWKRLKIVHDEIIVKSANTEIEKSSVMEKPNTIKTEESIRFRRNDDNFIEKPGAKHHPSAEESKEVEMTFDKKQESMADVDGTSSISSKTVDEERQTSTQKSSTTNEVTVEKEENIEKEMQTVAKKAIQQQYDILTKKEDKRIVSALWRQKRLERLPKARAALTALHELEENGYESFMKEDIKRFSITPSTKIDMANTHELTFEWSILTHSKEQKIVDEELEDKNSSTDIGSNSNSPKVNEDVESKEEDDKNDFSREIQITYSPIHGRILGEEDKHVDDNALLKSSLLSSSKHSEKDDLNMEEMDSIHEKSTDDSNSQDFCDDNFDTFQNDEKSASRSEEQSLPKRLEKNSEKEKIFTYTEISKLSHESFLHSDTKADFDTKDHSWCSSFYPTGRIEWWDKNQNENDLQMLIQNSSGTMHSYATFSSQKANKDDKLNTQNKKNRNSSTESTIRVCYSLETALKMCLCNPIKTQCELMEQVTLIYFLHKTSFYRQIVFLRQTMLGFGQYLQNFSSCLRDNFVMRQKVEANEIDCQFVTSRILSAHHQSLFLCEMNAEGWSSLDNFTYRLKITDEQKTSCDFGFLFACCDLPSPLSLIIDNCAMNKYRKLQIFLLRHIRMEQTMHDLWSVFAEHRSHQHYTHKLPQWLCLFRHHVQHKLSMLSQYINLKLQSSWMKISKRLSPYLSRKSQVLHSLQDLYLLHKKDLDWLLTVFFQENEYTSIQVVSYLERLYEFVHSLSIAMRPGKEKADEMNEGKRLEHLSMLPQKQKFTETMKKFEKILASASYHNQDSMISLSCRDLHTLLFL